MNKQFLLTGESIDRWSKPWTLLEESSHCSFSYLPWTNSFFQSRDRCLRLERASSLAHGMAELARNLIEPIRINAGTFKNWETYLSTIAPASKLLVSWSRWDSLLSLSISATLELMFFNPYSFSSCILSIWLLRRSARCCSTWSASFFSFKFSCRFEIIMSSVGDEYMKTQQHSFLTYFEPFLHPYEPEARGTPLTKLHACVDSLSKPLRLFEISHSD